MCHCYSASSDSAVERNRKYNSADPVSHTKSTKPKSDGPGDSGDSSGEPAVITQAFQQFAERNKVLQEVEKEKLALAMRRDAREEKEHEDLVEMRRRQDKRDAQAAREVQWKRALDMCNSQTEAVRIRGLELMDRLDAEEAAERAGMNNS